MGVNLHCWELEEADGRRKPVLRVHKDGTVCTDPGREDCFSSPMAAAEAAWRMTGRQHGAVPRWLESAHAALELPPTGRILAGDFHPPRVLGSAALADGSVAWISKGTGTEPSHPPAVRPPLPSPPPRIPAEEARTEVAPTQQRAGAPATIPTPNPPPPGRPDEPLSGPESGEWAFADIAGGGATTRPAAPTRLGPVTSFLADETD